MTPEKEADWLDKLCLISSQPKGREVLNNFAKEFGTKETEQGNILPNLPPDIEVVSNDQD